MRIKAVSKLFLVLMVFSALNLIINTRDVTAGSTVYIRPDGSIDPPTAPIQRVGDTYTLTADIYDSLVIQKDNIIVDGAGYTLQGAGSGYGIYLTYRNNVTVEHFKIVGFGTGIYMEYADRNMIIDNNVLNSAVFGIHVGFDSDYNSVLRNLVANSMSSGVSVYNNIGNSFQSNTLTNNTLGNYPGTSGMWMEFVGNSTVWGNTVTHNPKGAMVVWRTAYTNDVLDNTIANNTGGGILLIEGNNLRIIGNRISDNGNYGIQFSDTAGNVVSGNTIERDHVGISISNNLWLPSSHRIVSNTIAYNDIGLLAGNAAMDALKDSFIFHNNFVENTEQAKIVPLFPGNPTPPNFWDDGYPSGGNFWSDYNGTDLYSGSYQNILGSDGIGDTPVIIDPTNIDHYPLMTLYNTSDFFVLRITTTSGGTTNPPPGLRVHARNTVVDVTAFPDSEYLFDNWELDGLNAGTANPISVVMYDNHVLNAVFRLKPDIAVTKVLAYPDNVRRGQLVYIDVSVENQYYSAATFDLIVYADKDKAIIGDEVIIGVQTVNNLLPSSTTTVTFVWNTGTLSSSSTYYISAQAVVTGDRDPSDNLLTAKKKVTVRR